MEIKFLAVVAVLSFALFLAYLYGRRLRRLLYWRALIRQLEQMPVAMEMLTEAMTNAMVSTGEFSGAMMEVSKAMALEEEEDL